MNQSTCLYIEHALTPQKRVKKAFCKKTLAELAPTWDRAFIALVDGKAVLREDWDALIYTGHVVVFIDVRAIPQGGGGGGSNPLKIIAGLVVMVAAIYTQQYYAVGEGAALFGGAGAAASFGGAVAGGAVMLAGNALINIAMPPETTSLSSSNSAAALQAASPTYSIQAQGNSARLEAAIPEHFGRHIAYPDFGAQPYSEAHGNEIYLYQLLVVGRGHFDIESIRIEDTDIGNFEDITYEIIPPGGSVTLFPANVETSSEVSGQDLPTGSYVGPFTANAEETQAHYLGFDLVAPRGLYYANDGGGLAAMTVTADLEARLINDVGAPIGSWTVIRSVSYTGATTTPQRYSEKVPVSMGRYEARVKRTDTEQTDTRYGHDLVWGGLRAYINDTREFGDVTLLPMILKASSQLSSQASRKINVIATRKLPIWNGSTWSSPQPTRSIAWAMTYCCKQVGMTDAQIDLSHYLYLDGIWAARGDTCDGRIDSFMGFWDALTKIASAGRSKPYSQAGITRVWRDQPETLPVAHFSMMNIVKGSFSVNYLMPTQETADAIDVGYFDAAVWKQRRVRAALPDSTAEKPTKLETSFITSRANAYKCGMWMAASNRYRRKVIKLTTEQEGFIPSYGDLISIQHDMPAWGQAGEAIVYNVTTRELTTSEPLEWAEEGTHYCTLRKKDGSFHGPVVVTKKALYDNVMILADAVPFTVNFGSDYERTFYTFGQGNTWGQLAKVLAVRPRSQHSVEIEAVNEDPSVHTAEDGTTAPLVQTSQLTGYMTAPVIEGLIGTSMPGAVETMLLSWKPSPWAEYYLIEQSSDGETWTRTGETGTSNYTATAIYGSATIVRICAVGMTAGPWVTINYGGVAGYMWNANDTTLMWNSTDTTLMWS